MKLLRSLMVHQNDAMKFAEVQTNPYFAMAMRTGKTLVAIRDTVKKYGRGAKVLVVAPLTVLIPWAKELRREGIEPRALLASDKESMVADKGPGWYLVGVAACRINSYILGQKWDRIIGDEGTFMRNPEAQVSIEMNAAGVRADSRVLLSGWPCPEGESDWFSQMRFLGHGTFMGCTNFYQWRHRHFSNVDYDWVPKPGAALLIKRALEGKVFFLNAAQAGMPDLFVEEVRYVEMEKDQREIYEQVARDFEAGFEGHSLSTKWLPVKDLRLHQVASGEVAWDDRSRTRFHPKTNEVIDLLQGELCRGRVVVFFRFDSGVDMVGDALKRMGIYSRRITGATSLADRESAIADYHAGRARVLLLQAECGKYALDLSAGSTAIFYSQGYSFETWFQCRARLKHPSKTSSNLLVYLVAKDTLEEDIVPALKQKKSVGDFYFSRIFNKVKK